MAIAELQDEQLSVEQTAAIDKAVKFAHDQHHQVLTIGGRAGTGKTTIVKKIIDKLPERKIAVVAFTGKATSQLKMKGVSGAQTLHSLIYNLEGVNQDGSLRFRKVTKLHCDLVVADEASTISDDLHKDLLSFDAQILYVGDHWQLEPIGTNPNLMKSPDIVLEEIHRQAANSPILKLATWAHEGVEQFPHGVTQGLEISDEPRFWTAIYETDVAIVGFNKTRHRVNRILRNYHGYNSSRVEAGERIIFLKNNREYGVYNGMTATVTRVGRRTHGYSYVNIVDDAGQELKYLCLLNAQFGTDSLAHQRLSPDVLLADWGYCLSCHKAQGSEWKRVSILEQIAPAWTPSRWRYTAITRGAEQVIYCQGEMNAIVKALQEGY